MSYFKWTKEGKEIDNDYGVDIDLKQYDKDYQVVGRGKQAMDNTQYGDYDLFRKPVIGGTIDSSIVLSHDGGVQNIDDYLVDDKNRYKKYGISENMDDILEDINNGRLRDINVTQELKVPLESDITIHKDNNQTSIKGLLEQNSINDIFFSEMNVSGLQDSIRYGVYKETEKVIDKQSDNELYIVMRSIMLQFANFRESLENTVEEIKRLNRKVTIYCVKNISSNVKQYMGYIDDLSKLPVPLDRPVYHNKTNFTYDISNLL